MNAPLTGTGRLVRLYFRLDRTRQPLWVLGISVLVGVTPASIGNLVRSEMADTGETAQEVLASQAALVSTNGAIIALNGPPDSLDTFGGRYAFELGAFLLVVIALMNILLGVRHTRSDEEAGRLELVRAGAVGPWAPLAAVGIELTVANGAIGLIAAGLFIADGLDPGRCLLFGLGLTLTGLVFAAIAAVWSQITEFGRAAVGASLATLGVAFVVRSFGDVTENGASWLSPLGWTQQLDAFGSIQPAALIVPAVAIGAISAGALWLSVHRDVGGGLISAGVGPDRATSGLVSPWGLAWRLSRTVLAAWTVGLAALGTMYGVLIEDMNQILEENEAVAEMIEAAGVDLSLFRLTFGALVLTMLSIVGTGGALQLVLRCQSEEASGRAETVLGGAVDRGWWLGSFALLGALGAAVVMTAAATGLTLGDAARTGSPEWGFVAAGWARLPAMLVFVSLALALFGWRRRAAPGVWLAFTVAAALLMFGPSLDLPTWVLNLSVYTHVNHRPAADQGTVATVVLLAAAAFAAGLGIILFRRRDVG